MGKRTKYPYDENELIECKICKQMKIAKDFYKQLIRDGDTKTYRFRYCKECYRPISAEYRRKRILEVGSPRVLNPPNAYMDETQKRLTFEFLNLIGYLYDEPTGIWWKPKVKEIIDGKPVFPNIKERDVERRGRRKK